MMTLLIVCSIIFIVNFGFIITISTSDLPNQCEMAWHIDRSAINCIVLNVCALLAYPLSTRPSHKYFFGSLKCLKALCHDIAIFWITISVLAELFHIVSPEWCNLYQWCDLKFKFRKPRSEDCSVFNYLIFNWIVTWTLRAYCIEDHV